MSITFEKRDVELADTAGVEAEARAYFREHFVEEPFTFQPAWYSVPNGKWRFMATATLLSETIEPGADLPVSDRRKYWDTIHTLIKYLDRHGSLTTDELAEINKIKEEHSWDGLNCSCGGGWLVGHMIGCPEVKQS